MARQTSPSTHTPNSCPLILVVYGPEDALRREAMGQLQNAAKEAHGAVDIIRFEGATCGLAEILDELRSFGLMQQFKIVVVDDADRFVTAHRAALERYAQKPVDHGTLVLRCNRWHKSNLDKLIQKVGQIIKCESLKRPAIKTRLQKIASKRYNRRLDANGSDLMIDLLGTDLGRLDTELAKLALLVDDDQRIEIDLIRQTAGRASNDQAWVVGEALLDAIASGPASAGRAIEKIHELVKVARQADILVAYFLADTVRNLNLGLMMKRQGLSDRQVASRLKLWGPRQFKFSKALAKLSDASAANLLNRAVSYDARAKRGMGRSITNNECFCAALDDVIFGSR